jgi:elongation factor P
VDHHLRRNKLSARLPELEIDALLVTRLPNVRYLTGFTGSNGQALVTSDGDGDVFMTDGRYTEQSRREVPDMRRETYLAEFATMFAKACRDAKVSRVGFETAGITYKLWEQLSATEGVSLVPVGPEIERLRWVKDRDEIALLDRAQAITDEAFDRIQAKLVEGITERDVALELEWAMRQAGAEGLSFDSIVAFGESAAEPHHHPSDRALKPGDVVKFDFGALYGGYHADMTRTIAFGEPPAEIREIHALVTHAERAGIEAVRERHRPGRPGRGLQPLARPRRRAGDPRRSDPPRGLGGRPPRWRRRHRGAGRVHPGARGRPDRGHGRDHRGRRPGDRDVDPGARGGMSVSTNDLKNGMTLQLDGELWTVLDFLHHKPGKGQAVVRTKLRNVKTGNVLDRTFRADEKVGLAIVEKQDMQFLYRDGSDFVFMNTSTYDQITVPEGVAGDAAKYLSEGAGAVVAVYEGNAISVELPAAVVLSVTKTDPGVKGDRVSGALKPATLQTGIRVQVPLCVEEGDRVKVDTRTGEYLTREK